MPLVQISLNNEDMNSAYQEGQRFGLSAATYIKYFYIACLRAGVKPPDGLIEEAKTVTVRKAKGKERKLQPLPGIEPFNSKWKGYRG